MLLRPVQPLHGVCAVGAEASMFTVSFRCNDKRLRFETQPQPMEIQQRISVRRLAADSVLQAELR